MANAVFDVAVVGAGAAGLAAALAFEMDGFRTALVGPTGSRRDGRTVALLDGSVRLMRALGVWEALAAEAAPLETLRIVDDTGSLFRPPPVAFRASEIGLDAFGWNIENATLVERLAAAARASAGLMVIDGTVTAARSEAEAAHLTLADGGTIAARLVVAADGRRSALREAAGIESRTWSYPQAAVTTILAHERDHRDTSTEFHTRSGPFTLVPLPGRRSSLVWVTAPARAEALSALGEDALARAVETQAHSILGGMTVAGPRGVVPLTGLSAARIAAPRLALVGEAAHVLPPIGAQGLNLGLRDVASLRDALVDARSAGGDPGGEATLRRWARGRALDVGLRTGAVDGLNRTLLSGLLPVDFLRGAGLLAVGGVGPLRRIAMREGILPRIGAPRLMRDEPVSERGRSASSRS